MNIQGVSNTLIIYQTPLHIASQKNAIDVARLLIEKRGDVNAKGEIYQITFHQIFMVLVLIFILYFE